MMEFPQDKIARTVSKQFMWGSALLITPVLEEVSIISIKYLTVTLTFSSFDVQICYIKPYKNLYYNMSD